MEPSDPFTQPSFSKVLLSFAVGIVVGAAIVFPAIRNDLVLTTVEEPGPIGSVLIIGVLSIMVVTVGLVGLYQLFWLVDK